MTPHPAAVRIDRHDYAAPTALLTDRGGRLLESGTIVAWWTADLVVHAFHPLYPEQTRCGWPARPGAIPLGWALQVARPCRTCWRVPMQLPLFDAGDGEPTP